MLLNDEKRKEFFHGDPLLNVVSKDEFQRRLWEVFTIISKTLAQSFGAYGSPTFISNYPYNHVTKDGYTILKNLTFDMEEGSIVDCIAYDMISDICGRLNYKVGDGTTTAVIATQCIYTAYYQLKEYMDNNHILPRDIMDEFTKIKNQLVKKIKKNAISFTDSKESTLDAIEKVVRVSSNGNEEITKMITEIYDKLGYPTLSVELAKDGKTKYNIIEGFRGNVYLTDKIYINTDDGFCQRRNIDVVVFDHRIETDCYNYIISPLHGLSKEMGRSLLVIAPAYSENTITNVIQRDIMEEYRESKSTTLILSTCACTTSTSKRSLGDLAMLLDTTIIDRDLAHTIIKEASLYPENPTQCIVRYFNFDRKIEGMRYLIYQTEKDPGLTITIKSETAKPVADKKEAIDVGFTGFCRLGIDFSVFSEFHYDQLLYDKFLEDAKKTMEDTIDKYSKISVFNYETIEATKRYNALLLKTAVIEAGGDSELSKKLLKDSIEDSIRAAESAYNNGYILGCNVTTLRCLNELFSSEDSDDDLNSLLKGILFQGFVAVYSTVLLNAYENIEFTIPYADALNFMHGDKELIDNIVQKFNIIGKRIGISDLFEERIIKCLIRSRLHINSENENDSNNEEKDTAELVKFGLHDYIIAYSIENNEVFDLTTKSFNQNIINSAATDIEVVTSVIDLMGMLITGKQLVVTGKHNF